MPSLPLASRTLLLGLGTLTLLLAAPRARAQNCEQDSDCRAGQICTEVDISEADCRPGQPCVPPEDGSSTIRGCIGQPCSSDDDCPSGMGCDIRPASSPPCAAGEDCSSPPDASVEGYCEAQEIECTRNADCPEGLLCVEQQGGDVACASSPDGGTTCEEPEDEPAISECSFVREECESDDDCTQDGFACITMGGAESCSSDVPACDSDGNCPDASEPECQVETETRCFPARVDCDDDTDCATDWVCYALPEESDDSWGDFSGATDVCLPEGLVLALDEQIGLGDSGSDSAGSGSDRADTGGAEPEAAGDDDADAGSVNATSMTGSNVVMDDDGCAVSAPGSAGHRGGSGLMLLGLLTLLLRARKRG